MINIRELATNPSLLNEETLPELKEMLEKYPFFQVVRLLYVANLYKLHSQGFGTELRKASVFVPDRTALFALTESTNYQLPIQEN
ncbi:MAG: tetratricopeptide repeat protein, partial [Bacteroidaceae bacterium]|nr:tetratricopeptide repeat protein [Bacteroidaceae bacterium]